MALQRSTLIIIAGVVGVIVLFALVVGIVLWYHLFREVTAYYASPEEHFKYGSIGAERETGIPYLIWLALPRMFPEKLPGEGGLASLGVKWEEGREMPIGFTKETIGFPRVAINCGTCHVTQYRTSPEAEPRFIVGGPSHELDSQSYQRFLLNSASDPRFTADNILNEISSFHDMSWFETLLYRYIIIPQTRRALLEEKEAFAWTEHRPPWGPGRLDPFNPVKFQLFQLPEDGSVGNSDIPPIWNQEPRVGMSLHWDGLLATFWEIAINSAIGDGARGKALDFESLHRVEAFLKTVPPPQYPFAVDAALAAQGSELYASQCASCHAFGGERTGTVIPVEEVGTDRHRVDAWTWGEVEAWIKLAEDYDEFSFETIGKRNGYVAMPLDGVWARAPYLHNGSVPSLQDLLTPPEQRPALFYRGYNVYDPEKVGFISQGPEAQRAGFRYDTAVTGNANGGHNYGTELSPAEKSALIEYLKTQ